MWHGVMHVENGDQPVVQPGLVGLAVVVVPRRTSQTDTAPFLAIVADLQRAAPGPVVPGVMLQVARATAARVAPDNPQAFRLDRCRWIVVDPQGYFDEAVFAEDGAIDWQPVPGDLPRSLQALLALEGGVEAWAAFQRIPDVGDLASVIEGESEVRRIGGLG